RGGIAASSGVSVAIKNKQLGLHPQLQRVSCGLRNVDRRPEYRVGHSFGAANSHTSPNSAQRVSHPPLVDRSGVSINHVRLRSLSTFDSSEPRHSQVGALRRARSSRERDLIAEVDPPSSPPSNHWSSWFSKSFRPRSVERP